MVNMTRFPNIVAMTFAGRAKSTSDFLRRGGDMTNLRIYDMPEKYVVRAMALALRFSKEFPDRIGYRNYIPCALNEKNGYTLCVHRTKGGMIVVRGEG